jgi:hypothetical protein
MGTVKALSLMQPWATWVAIGLKSYDTWPWRTEYRGPLLIHASRRSSKEGRLLYEKIKAILGPEGELIGAWGAGVGNVKK